MNFAGKGVDFKQRLFPDMPESATTEEWNEWNDKAKQYKFKWFIADTVPDWLVSTFTYPYERVSKLMNKYIRKHSQINITTLKDNEWYDTETRMLHGMFQLLVDYVELEKAHVQIIFKEKDTPMYMRNTYYRSGIMGLKYLDWEVSLGKKAKEFSNQSKNAKIVRDLYIWWTSTRPQRTDVMDVKGSMGVSTNEFYNDEETLSSIGRRKDKEPELYEDVNKAYEDAEKAYKEEDEKMLIKLIKIRDSLWT